MATTGESNGLTKEDLATLATKKDIVDMVSRSDLDKLAWKKDVVDLARKAEMEALAVQLDDTRTDLLEQTKQHAQQTRADFEQLWAFVSHPPPDAALPLLEDLLAVLRPPPVAGRGWPGWRWPALVVLAAGLGVGAGWWWFRPGHAMQAWARLGERMDRVLVEQYTGLPSVAQQAVQNLYTQLGIAPPATRKGKR